MPAPHVERMLVKRYELYSRLIKLTEFTNGEVFKTLPLVDQEDLVEQLKHMEGYCSVLERRIQRAEEPV